MFYEKIDNLLIANCQHLVWHIELLTSIRQSSLARLTKRVNQIFVAILTFFTLSIIVDGSYEALTVLFVFLLPFSAFHYHEIEVFSNNTLTQPSEEKEIFIRPESVTKRKKIRRAIFLIGLPLLILFVYASPVRKGDLSWTALCISIVLFLSPVISFLSEFVLCTVTIPKTKREEIQNKRRKK